MKRSSRKENGSASLFVLIAMLFFIIFLISMYTYASNSEITQLEQVSKIKSIYERNINNLDSIYDKLIGQTTMIPIYNLEQLKKIGSGEDLIIDNKTYNFSSNAQYKLMNDIEIEITDLPLESTENFTGNIEGKNNTLIIKADEEILAENIKLFKNELESYTNLNIEIQVNYYTFTINPNPRDAKIKITNKKTNETVETNTIEVIKSTEVEWEVSAEGYTSQSGSEIVQADVTKDVNLESITYYTFTITPTPADAKVTINGEERTSLTVEAGTSITWEVSAPNYQSQTGTETINSDVNKTISLSKTTHTLTINTTPADATVTLNGVQRKSITVDYGTTVTYNVEYNGYHSQSGNFVVTKDETQNISLRQIIYVPFSETFYLTTCTNSTYNGLLNNGTTTVSHSIASSARNIDMGLFEFDPVGIANKIPLDANISKITVYYKYRQSRMSTSLYINRVKISIYTGTTEKMPEYSTSPVGNTFINGSHELTNINRSELANGLRVHLVNYYKGSLSITSYLENVYCVIEGEYPT